MKRIGGFPLVPAWGDAEFSVRFPIVTVSSIRTN